MNKTFKTCSIFSVVTSDARLGGGGDAMASDPVHSCSHDHEDRLDNAQSRATAANPE
eukprot:CAMPEP_0175961856 /NCGR_PEP_ID=MMETSP0108-20121206/36161_1 /TAXON_ID=195067 ORGANISM="Goniomonas pacifica, Strain CCMP1869" /NCGR_SAMPLE_ID=MMETSP0108 /ASSEMBLY_ACC=CAM_ASM_000204 /LENGTH=56 /DNA_ID=CAMNT_0017289619 /DNA_START=66 /DNA_END=236 /DNA_ORIENTATION=+